MLALPKFGAGYKIKAKELILLEHLKIVNINDFSIMNDI